MGKENHYGDKWPLGLKPASPKRAPRLKVPKNSCLIRKMHIFSKLSAKLE